MRFIEQIKYFFEGMGSISLYPMSSHYDGRTPQEKDTQALASDWRRVGKDLTNSIKKFEGKRGIN